MNGGEDGSAKCGTVFQDDIHGCGCVSPLIETQFVRQNLIVIILINLCGEYTVGLPVGISDWVTWTTNRIRLMQEHSARKYGHVWISKEISGRLYSRLDSYCSRYMANHSSPFLLRPSLQTWSKSDSGRSGNAISHGTSLRTNPIYLQPSFVLGIVQPEFTSIFFLYIFL